MELLRSDISLLQKKLKISPAVVILGPRQVGKTTFALQAAKSLTQNYLYLDMESGQDFSRLSEDPETFLQLHKEKLVIIDEIQAMPLLYSRLRSVIDRDRTNGRFILLGSATPHLVHGVSESLAGRVSYLDLPPLKLSEISSLFDWKHQWFRGGFPRALLAPTNEEFVDWMNSYIRTYIQVDLSTLFGINLNPAISRRLWYMLGHNHSNIVNVQDLSRSIGVTAPVITRYMDYLEGAFLIYKLQPWYTNVGKRLVKSPKVYIKDPGILHALMNIQNFDQLTLHPHIGASWEGYVIEQIMYHLPSSYQLYYYRTHSGTEIDLVIVKGSHPISSIEIKFSNIPAPTKGYYIGIEDLKTEKNFIITPQSESYVFKGATVCSLSDFISLHLGTIENTKK